MACPAIAVSLGADRRTGQAQRHLNRRGGIHRGAVPKQNDIKAGAERVKQLDVPR